MPLTKSPNFHAQTLSQFSLIATKVPCKTQEPRNSAKNQSHPSWCLPISARMLHNCLLSIAGQSRKDLIKEVIASENSDDI